jgi:hypothetical protein
MSDNAEKTSFIPPQAVASDALTTPPVAGVSNPPVQPNTNASRADEAGAVGNQFTPPPSHPLFTDTLRPTPPRGWQRWPLEPYYSQGKVSVLECRDPFGLNHTIHWYNPFVPLGSGLHFTEMSDEQFAMLIAVGFGSADFGGNAWAPDTLAQKFYSLPLYRQAMVAPDPLRAAAPDLLAAVRQCLTNALDRLRRAKVYTDAEGNPSKADVQAEIDALRAAIAKATGQ